jgi:hypothetical protein
MFFFHSDVICSDVIPIEVIHSDVMCSVIKRNEIIRSVCESTERPEGPTAFYILPLWTAQHQPPLMMFYPPSERPWSHHFFASFLQHLLPPGTIPSQPPWCSPACCRSFMVAFQSPLPREASRPPPGWPRGSELCTDYFSSIVAIVDV